ncbi:MAG: prepilin-type N-terminal cleavage/methylation domain-containing protein [Sedimentisphaerales bacterium]|nr:prepilin-type N-terminal cleavage/methylation domain-containing protein [Sedimentisphaerales bacterium]
MKKRHAFTLIELLVVISIIALLISILMPALNMARSQAKITVCATRLHQVGLAMTEYSLAFEKLPAAEDKYGNPESHAYAAYRGDSNYLDDNGDPIPLRWALLYEEGFMETPECFYCPANRNDWTRYESYTNPLPWGSLPQVYNTTNGSNQWVRIGYTYFTIPKSGVQWDDYRLKPAQKFDSLDPDLPYATDILHGRSNLSHQKNKSSDNFYHKSSNYSVNALYPDAHVSLCKDETVFDENTAWEWFANESIDLSSSSDEYTYDAFYYEIFKLIGSR